LTRRALEAHLRDHGCVQLREGARHAIWGNAALDLRAPLPLRAGGRVEQN